MNNIKDTISTIFDGIEGIINSKQIVGDKIVVGDTTIIPFIEHTMGMGMGDFENKNGAGGVAVKSTPIACLIIKDGFTKVMSIKNNDPISKALDIIPDLVNKMVGNETEKSVKEKIDDIDEDVDVEFYDMDNKE